MIPDAFLVLLLIMSIIIIEIKDLIHAIIILAGADVVLALSFYLMAAPDIAITQIAVGAALTTMIFLIAIHKTRRFEE